MQNAVLTKWLKNILRWGIAVVGIVPTKWLKNILRWGIAVVGIWWVVSQMSLWDKVLVVNSNGLPTPMTLAEPAASENQPTYRVVGRETPIPRSEIVSKPDRKKIKLANGQEVPLLGLDIEYDSQGKPRVDRLFVAENGK